MLTSTHIYSFLFLSLAVHGGEQMYNQALLIPANLFNVSKASLKKKMPPEIMKMHDFITNRTCC